MQLTQQEGVCISLGSGITNSRLCLAYLFKDEKESFLNMLLSYMKERWLDEAFILLYAEMTIFVIKSGLIFGGAALSQKVGQRQVRH